MRLALLAYLQPRFEGNLQQMADMAREANVDLMFVAPCPNLQEWTPVMPLLDDSYGEEQQALLVFNNVP